MDLEPGRIGFMNTQRREDRWQRITCTQRAGASPLSDRSWSPGWLSDDEISALIAQLSRAFAKVGTAPDWFHPSDEDLSPGAPDWFHPSDEDLSPGAPDWLATNSLQSDYRCLNLVISAGFVCFVCKDSRRSSPPPGNGMRAATGALTTHRSSLPFIPSPSGFVSIHPTLPQFPAGKRRWLERYDGKRDLYLQHAA